MVEGVRAGGIGGAARLTPDGTRTVAGQFTLDGGAPPNQNTRLSSVTGIGLESMLALQAVDESVERDRAARKRATRIIALLTDLQRATLTENDPSSVLNALNELTTDCPLADDPGLGAIVRAVLLRSRVEIARRESQAGGRRFG